MRFPTEKSDRLNRSARLVLVIGLLYVFLAGVKALESAIQCFGSGFAEGLLEAVSSPICGLAAGMLATVLVQSSSVTTATIVGLVGSGALTVGAAVPMVMGANIGTTVTATLAALGHLRKGPEFERAFAGATVHDFFNLLAVLLLFPIEMATHFLEKGARFLTDLIAGAGTSAGNLTQESFIKSIVKAPVSFTQSILENWTDSRVVVGASLLILGLACIFFALAFITSNMRKLMAGGIERSFNKILSTGGGLGGMVVGTVLTVMVQSSSITTSVLIPLLAAGVITLENAFPVTLGANIGTTVTGLLASMAADRPEALTIALVHTLFNVTGTLVFYPFRRLRRIPIVLAQKVSAVASEHRRMVVVYVIGVFVVVPLLVLTIGR